MFSLAQAFNISPLEIYKMPQELVQDMLNIHMVSKQIESEEYEKATKKMKR